MNGFILGIYRFQLLNGIFSFVWENTNKTHYTPEPDMTFYYMDKVWI